MRCDDLREGGATVSEQRDEHSLDDEAELMRATHDGQVLDKKVVHMGETARFDSGRTIVDIEVRQRD